jgi:hypothetical protein
MQIGLSSHMNFDLSLLDFILLVGKLKVECVARALSREVVDSLVHLVIPHFKSIHERFKGKV